MSKEPLTILVADDEESTRLLYHDELEDEGYKVITVENGYEVLFNLETEKIDLVITDSSMPLMDAFTMIHEIQQKYPGLPIVVITGHSNEAEYIAKGCAIQAFFKKPVNIKCVKDAIRGILEN